MSGTVGIGSSREFAVGWVMRALRRAASPIVGYLRSVRSHRGLPVGHAVPVAVAVTALLTWALVAAASTARPV
jgi:hypothetical protein